MPSFSDHNKQANSNIGFVNFLQKSNCDYFDWKVTAAFYTAVHIVNAHLHSAVDEHYQRHSKVELALNPENELSPAKISMDAFIAYKKLHNLSRRSRYLIHEDEKSRDVEGMHYISEKHFSKAKNRLTEIMQYFEEKYNIKYTPLDN